jgi:hypothetical protein
LPKSAFDLRHLFRRHDSDPLDELDRGTNNHRSARLSLMTFVPVTSHGRPLRIPELSVGSSRTRHTSPRWGIARRFQHFVRKHRKFLFDTANLRVPVGNFTGTRKLPVTLG